MSFTFLTWLLLLIPMPLLIVCSFISYLRNRKQLRNTEQSS